MSVTFTLLPKVVGLGGGSRVPSWPASIVLSRQVFRLSEGELG